MDNIDNFDLGESLLNISTANKKMDLSMIKEAGEEGGSQDGDLQLDDFDYDEYSLDQGYEAEQNSVLHES